MKNTIFAEKTFADCLLLPHQRMPHTQISQRKPSQIATKPWNSWQFSPPKVSCYIAVWVLPDCFVPLLLGVTMCVSVCMICLLVIVTTSLSFFSFRRNSQWRKASVSGKWCRRTTQESVQISSIIDSRLIPRLFWSGVGMELHNRRADTPRVFTCS